MQLVDIGILAALLLPALAGVFYGFLNIVLSIIAWVAALGISFKLTGVFSPMLASLIETEIVRSTLTFVLLFMASLILLTAAGYFMLKLLGRSGLTAADRILGLLFGFGLGAAVVAVAIFLAGFTDLTRASWWQQSLLVSPFERTAVWVRQFLPDSLAKYHYYAGEDGAKIRVNG